MALRTSTSGFFQGARAARSQPAGEPAQLDRQGLVGGLLLLVAPLDLADLDLELGADVLVLERLEQPGHRLVLLRPAPQVQLGPALRGLGLR